MSQHDYDISNASGAAVRSDLNNVLAAIKSNNAGTSAPTSTTAGMWWLDTTGGAPYTLKIRDAGDNHWLTVCSVTDPGADTALDFGGGKIQQVVSTTITDTVSTSGSSSPGAIITDFSLAITPASTSNKIFLTASIVAGNDNGKRNFYVFNGGSSAVVGDAASGHECHAVAHVSSTNNQEMITMTLLDSPSTTSAITYSVYWWVEGNTGYVNRAGTQDAYQGNGVSTITAMEVAA